MKKPPYITVLTALALVFRFHAVYHLNILLLPLTWAAALLVLLAGELIGTRIGKGSRYAPNIGAAVSSALISAASAIWLISVMRVYPADYLGTMWGTIYDVIGFAAVSSLLINLGSVIAKRVLVWRERHGSLPSDELSLKAFRAHFIVTGALNLLDAAAFYFLSLVILNRGILDADRYLFICNAFATAFYIAILAETANMIGIFFNRLLEKHVINNALTAIVGAFRIVVGIRYLARVNDFTNDPFLFASNEDILVSRLSIAVWAAVIIAMAVWAAVKLRGLPKKKG